MDKKDLELFERAMATLGVKPQPGELSRRGGKGPAMPTLSDDGLDFDAIMRSSRGPATLQRPPRPTPQAKAEAPVEGATVAPVERRTYTATAEELALFEAAMAGELDLSVRTEDEGVAPSPKAAPEPLSVAVKRRRFELDAQLDLHGRTRVDAEPRVRAFLEEAVRERWEYVAIVCGRGVHSRGGEAVLKPLVLRWLREDLRTFAVEVVEAPPQLGGGGTLIARVRLDMRA